MRKDRDAYLAQLIARLGLEFGAAVLHAVDVLDAMTESEREEVFLHYHRCGSTDPRCQCDNDE